ncbi:MAG: hypothetical protein IKG46_05070 [Solobacterium sp.]|nr:hypothetical protein [Solobacterium sp.]
MKHMKYRKTAGILLAAAVLSPLSACAKTGAASEEDMIRLEFVIPAAMEEGFYYADEEISTSRDTFTILAGDDMPDAELVLEPVDDQENITYQPSSIGAGETLELLIRKDIWYRVGIRTAESSDDPLQVHLQIKDAETRRE